MATDGKNLVLEQCFGCPLQERKLVPFSGPRDAKLAVVGEYPYYNEIREQRPFVGQAGDLLDLILDFLGLDRHDLRMGNAVLCGPVDEEDRTAPWFGEVVQRCRTRREAMNDIGDAQYVVALGGTAAWGLLGRRVVLGGKWPVRGALHHTPDGRVVIPTWDPAAILRAGGSDGKGRLSDADSETIGLDILRAWRLATGVLHEFQPTIRLMSDPHEFAEWCRNADWRVAVDIETDSIDPVTCKLLSVGLARRFSPWESTTPFSPLDGVGSDVPTLRPADPVEAISFWWPNADDEAREELRALLDNAIVTKTFHNHSFDAIVLERLIGPVHMVSDTIYLTHARFPDVRVNLADVAQTWLPIRPWKYQFHHADHKLSADLERMQQKGYRIPTWDQTRVEALLEYNAMDAAATIGAELPLVEECDREGVTEVAALDLALAQEAYKMTARGVRIDPEVREKIDKDTHDRLRMAEERLNRLIADGMRDPADRKAAETLDPLLKKNDGRLNYYSNKDLGLALDVCGVPVPAGKGSLTKSGQRALNKKSLAAISDHPVVAATANCKGLARIISTFFGEKDGAVYNLGPDGRLHVPWKVHGTPTGRWASGKEKDDVGFDEDVVSINLQNWPTWLRAMVTPEPGCVFVGADEAQLEYRCLALQSGEPILLGLFNDPSRPDLHNDSCARLYGPRWVALDPDLVDNPFEANHRKKQRKALRTVTKNGLYAAAYLANLLTVQQTLQSRAFRESDPEVAETLRRVSKPQCQEFIDAFPKLWPTLDAWRQRMVEEVTRTHETRCPISGRRRIWPLGMVEPSKCVNTPTQTLAGAIMNLAFLTIQEKLPPDAKIILQVHDSVVVECPKEQGDLVKKIITDAMTTTYTIGDHTCQFIGDAKSGMSWAVV